MTRSPLHSILPQPSSDESEHSRAAAAEITARLAAAGGWMPFDEFMDLALYAPGVGYYSAGSVKLGAGGDFVTAPEISDLFSLCVARQCADVLAETGGGILELGAGTGRMACTILSALAQMGAVPEQYAILEVSADLAERQRARVLTLPQQLRERVVWLDRLPVAPVAGAILVNEVLDALPCKRFIVRGEQAYELGVGLSGSLFGWQLAPADSHALTCVNDMIQQLPAALRDGYCSEVCTRVGPWINSVGACLASGAMLLFDYGLPRSHYYHPQRGEGTLRCYYKQRAHDDPFVNVGIQDITAWVDFTRVAEAALDAQLEVSGFATQTAFLLGTGIEGLVGEAVTDTDHARLAGEARRLLMPGEMGESFKAMALCRNLSKPLRGFAYQDLRASL